MLVPNRKGLDAAIAAGADEVVVFGAATESFSNATRTARSTKGSRASRKCARRRSHAGLKVRGDISVCLGCPYEGEVDTGGGRRTSRASSMRWAATKSPSPTRSAPARRAGTRRVIEAVAKHIPVERLAGHFHDTYGQAVANIYAALECGIATFDSSVAGLGGCPYAKGATGNVATEDVLFMLNGLGIETGDRHGASSSLPAISSAARSADRRTHESRARRAASSC